MQKIIAEMCTVVGRANVLIGEEISEEYAHDESLIVDRHFPEIVAKPGSVEEVAGIMRLADKERVPVTPRGSGTGLSGGCVPILGGILLSLERMNKIIEIDKDNSVAVVEAGAILAELHKAARAAALYYPIYPGEESATIGGNVATNAGGMRAVKYGVTRHFVIGLEAVLPKGQIISTGGKYVKVSSGYDLTQLLIGSEGTLAVITKVILRLLPYPKASTTLFVPFRSLNDGVKAVPEILKSGNIPATIEFLEKLGLDAMEEYTGSRVPLDSTVRDKAEAFLLIIVEGKNSDDTFRDADVISEICLKHGAIDALIPSQEKTSHDLLQLREKAFYAAKDAGATDLLDVVVPRGEIAQFVQSVHGIASKYDSIVTGAGHAGDGNIHLAVIEQDPDKLSNIRKEIYRVGKSLGGAISAEHGIGCGRREHFMETEATPIIRVMRGIKKVFDPHNIMNPGKIL